MFIIELIVNIKGLFKRWSILGFNLDSCTLELELCKSWSEALLSMYSPWNTSIGIQNWLCWMWPVVKLVTRQAVCCFGVLLGTASTVWDFNIWKKLTPVIMLLQFLIFGSPSSRFAGEIVHEKVDFVFVDCWHNHNICSKSCIGFSRQPILVIRARVPNNRRTNKILPLVCQFEHNAWNLWIGGSFWFPCLYKQYLNN